MSVLSPWSWKGYGHSVIFLAYFLTTLSSPKMKSDLLTVKQFSLTGMGLYKAMVRARCALVCLKAGDIPPVDTAAPSRFRMRSDPPSPELNKPGTSSPKRAILLKANHTGGGMRKGRKWGYTLLESRARYRARRDSGGVARSRSVLDHRQGFFFFVTTPRPVLLKLEKKNHKIAPVSSPDKTPSQFPQISRFAQKHTSPKK